jgi:hypothetical protein
MKGHCNASIVQSLHGEHIIIQIIIQAITINQVRVP